MAEHGIAAGASKLRCELIVPNEPAQLISVVDKVNGSAVIVSLS